MCAQILYLGAEKHDILRETSRLGKPNFIVGAIYPAHRRSEMSETGSQRLHNTTTQTQATDFI